VDATAAAEGTLPPTDTVAGESSTAAGSITPALVAVLAIGAAAFVIGLSFATRRVRQD
jgi:hypothetical protein